MIPVLLLAGVALAGVAIAVYWKEINAWIKRVWDKLPSAIKNHLKGALSFVQRIGNTARNIMKYYSYNETTKKWNETIVSTEVDESTVPAKFRNMAGYSQNQEVETTNDLEKELQLELTSY